MARILVTGAAGFVGSFVMDHFVRDGHEVFGTTTGLPRAKLHYCNIEDRASVAALLHKLRPEVIVHCAAISSVTSGRAMDYYMVNTVGTENLVEAFASSPSPGRFVFISTAGVYGNQDTEILHEGLCPKPVHHYGMSKFCSERLLANYAGQFDYTIIRPFNILGEGQNAQFIAPKLVDAFHRRLPVVKLGNLNVFRDYIDIMDAVKIITSLAFCDEARGETVNLCSGKPMSINDLIETLRELTGHELQVEVAPEFVRRNEVWRLLGDVTKLEEMMGGHLDLTPISQTLGRMLERSSASAGDPA